MSDFLTVNNLSKRYGTGPMVISGLNHQFSKGKATGLIGANGSGKTTFLRLVSVTAFPTEGNITFKGRSIYDAPHEFLKHIGIVTDATDLPVYLSASELLEWTLRARKKWDDNSSQKSIDNLFARLKFDERRHNLIGTYSSGMLQKTMLACSLITEPEIILLDEPFRALDEGSKKASIEILEEFKENGGTILVSSHLRRSLARICDDYINFPVTSG
ncbi:ABC transporter ATP-binding protein [Natronogracilivirga saccharolytica]|uniref:ABC transporter ATP-binding protein n=1 Tax=Natronogracilivirga saccharolytica TaxID=2812953 RepID=A0A8J7UU62_9BACT|nr:ABC transporter ATP-binding protein [Natronogracilivirga saccharolytica]MBP3191146.1 ABC transporter ATP-binding protein [Natronogracilivirga saccharolytica]